MFAAAPAVGYADAVIDRDVFHVAQHLDRIQVLVRGLRALLPATCRGTLDVWMDAYLPITERWGEGTYHTRSLPLGRTLADIARA